MDAVILTDRHLVAALEYVGRCRRAGDRRPVLELLEDIVSPEDARQLRRALVDVGAR